ncbi:MAG: hypothetical protein N2578_09995, partial [Bdellovibrionaceae bacterium]|nr:hypothetical protein [Pseudobdellovibrionaceae bacterium]
IKGYGGNAGKGYQPNGSLDAAEAYRDTVLSKILMEKGADTYIGALTVVRPASSSQVMANYIRLSRTTLRMNDLIDRKGDELKATVEHLRVLVSEELKSSITVEQFVDWLVKRSATTLAAKEHARVTASNHNKDNFGIAELVDFGEAKYDPFSFKKGYDVFGDKGSSWNSGLKAHVIAAANNIADVFGFKTKPDYSAIFDQTYKEREAALLAKDKARVLVDVVDQNELKKIGLSDLTIKRILDLRASLDFGLLTTLDILEKVPMTPAERKIVLENTTTQLMRTADGHILSNVLISELGGADGLRKVIDSALKELRAADMQNEKIVMDKIKEKVRQRMSEVGSLRFGSSGYWGPNVEQNLALHLSKKITLDPQGWTQRSLRVNQVSGAAAQCSRALAL